MYSGSVGGTPESFICLNFCTDGQHNSTIGLTCKSQTNDRKRCGLTENTYNKVFLHLLLCPSSGMD